MRHGDKPLKNTTFKDMFEMALTIYKIDLASQKACFEQQTIQKFRAASKAHPQSGARSYYAKARVATKNKGVTATRYFSEAEAFSIIQLNDDYLRKYSSDQNLSIEDRYARIQSEVKKVEEKLSKVPSREELRNRLLAEEEERQRREAEALNSWFEFEYDRKPASWEELNEYKERSNFTLSDDSDEMDYLPDPVPASSEDIALYQSDYTYEAVWGEYEDPFEPPIITGIRKRSTEPAAAEAKARERQMKYDAIIDLLFSMLFEPIEHDSLVEDIYRASDEDEVHHDSAYFEAKERLKSSDHYCHRKAFLGTDDAKLLSSLSRHINSLIPKAKEESASQSRSQMIRDTGIRFTDPKDYGKR